MVISIYRPCDGDKLLFFKLLEGLLNEVNKENKIIVLGGDFNIELKKENKHKTELKSLLESFSLYLHINEYTRITAETKSSIDNIFSSLSCPVEGVVICSHISDHTAQKITFTSGQNESVNNYEMRFYSDAAKLNFFNDLCEQDWSKIYSINNAHIDKQYDSFIRTFSQIFNHHFPKKKIVHKTSRNVSAYHDPEVIQCKKRLDLLHLLSSHDNQYKNIYKAEKRI